MTRSRGPQPVVSDELLQIDVDRAFAVLDWEMEDILGRHARSKVISDEQVLDVVRGGVVVGWEKGWSVLQPSTGFDRCSVRTLAAFPGRLWLLVNGVPVFEISSDDLRLAMLGSAQLIDRAVEAARQELDRKPD